MSDVIEHRLDARVVHAHTQSGGFSHGLAARLLLDDGTSVFAKAIRLDDALAAPYRTEAQTASRLPPLVPTPNLRFVVQTAGWLVVVFDFVDGRHPRLDHSIDRTAVLTLIDRLADELTPSPVPELPTFVQVYGEKLTCWQRFAAEGPPTDLNNWARSNLDRLAELEATWTAHGAGNTLLHTDLRPDNILLGRDGSILVVDWAWPCRGAAWIDLVLLAPAFARSGTNPDPILAAHRLTRDIDPTAINAYLCALVGYWEHQSRQSAPARSPNLRRYQEHSARVSGEWLSRRL